MICDVRLMCDQFDDQWGTTLTVRCQEESRNTQAEPGTTESGTAEFIEHKTYVFRFRFTSTRLKMKRLSTKTTQINACKVHAVW